jgi:hypothetical protein
MAWQRLHRRSSGRLTLGTSTGSCATNTVCIDHGRTTTLRVWALSSRRALVSIPNGMIADAATAMLI